MTKLPRFRKRLEKRANNSTKEQKIPWLHPSLRPSEHVSFKGMRLDNKAGVKRRQRTPSCCQPSVDMAFRLRGVCSAGCAPQSAYCLTLHNRRTGQAQY